MHNLGTVIQFEVSRTLKKKSFWLTALSFPVVIAVVFAIIFFSNQATHKASIDIQKQHFSLAITDQAGIISPQLIAQFETQKVANKQQGIDAVASGKLDAYFYYPADLSKQKVDVYAKEVGLFVNSRYQAVASSLLQQSVASKIDAQTVAALTNAVGFNSVTYKDGVVFDGFKQLIAPGVFLVLFYILISMFGGQMLTSTTEEKENRVIEMILTTVKARTLIIGKILSLVMLAFIQMLVILVPIIFIYLSFGSQLTLPSIDLTNIPLDPLRIAIGAIIFTLSFLLFTGLLVGIGAAVPTAKEASGFFSVVMVFIFGPLYAITLFVSAPHSGIVTFLSFFPLTAPIPLMLRNAVGNLSVGEALIGMGILTVCAAIALTVAVRLFRYGALEYSKRLSFKTIFGRN
ncbi:MAG: ABC transporter permease [Candidatus Saccharibacteria bacterium]